MFCRIVCCPLHVPFLVMSLCSFLLLFRLLLRSFSFHLCPNCWLPCRTVAVLFAMCVSYQHKKSPTAKRAWNRRCFAGRNYLKRFKTHYGQKGCANLMLTGMDTSKTSHIMNHGLSKSKQKVQETKDDETNKT